MCLVQHDILLRHPTRQQCTSSNELSRTAALFIEKPASLLPSLSLSCLLLLFTAYVGTRSGSTLHITPSCCSSCWTASVGYSSAGKNISTGKVQPAAIGYCDACVSVCGNACSTAMQCVSVFASVQLRERCAGGRQRSQQADSNPRLACSCCHRGWLSCFSAV